MKKIIFSAILLMMIVGSNCLADPLPIKYVNGRIKSIEQGIAQDIDNNRLKPADVEKLEAEIVNIQKEVNDSVKYGFWSEEESEQINAKLDRICKQVFNEERDNKDINWRIHHQQLRIADGIRSGRLTPQEVDALEDKLVAVQVEYNDSKKYGYFNEEERHHLEVKLDTLSREIERDKR